MEKKNKKGHKRNKILFSKYSSEEVTDVMDQVLDARDALLFQTLFRGCENGYFEEGITSEKMPKGNLPGFFKALRHRYVRKHMYVVLLIYLILLFLYSYRIGAFYFGWKEMIFYLLLACGYFLLISYTVYKEGVVPRRYLTCYGNEKNIVIWEDRKDKKHIGETALFSPLYGSKISRNHSELRSTQNFKSRIRIDRYLEVGQDLSWLRCMCEISEEIKAFVDSCDQEKIEINVSKDKDCNYYKRTGSCTITVTGRKAIDSDAIVLVEGEEESKSFTIPSAIGKNLEEHFQESKRLDLSIHDWKFENIKASGILAELKQE